MYAQITVDVLDQTFKISNEMEKRNTLLLITSIVFVFSVIYISTDSLLRRTTNNIVTSEEIEYDLTNEKAAPSKILKEEIETTIQTTTTSPTEGSLKEEEFSTYTEDLNIAESDGAEITTAELAIFATEEERIYRTQIASVDLNRGCLVETKEESNGNQWGILENNNKYLDNTINISLKVETSVNINTECVSNLILKILNDPRGWSTIIDKKFQFTSLDRSDFEIIFATPNTVDKLCAPLTTNGIYSCRRENKVVLNYFRWLVGAKDFGTDLSTYRLYLINHEIGHMLGWGHNACPAEGALAPLMMQQSKSTNGCKPYGWPTYERLSDVFDVQK